MKRNWKIRALNHANALVPRVDVLGKRFYRGCGFHYALESELAYLLRTIPYYEEESKMADAILKNIILEVRLRRLTSHIVKAERSAECFEQHDAQE